MITDEHQLSETAERKVELTDDTTDQKSKSFDLRHGTSVLFYGGKFRWHQVITTQTEWKYQKQEKQWTNSKWK